jgi:hypothetical protein
MHIHQKQYKRSKEKYREVSVLPLVHYFVFLFFSSSGGKILQSNQAQE